MPVTLPSLPKTPRVSLEPIAGAARPGRRIRIMLAIGGLGIGGAEMVVRDLALFLDRDVFDVCICCTKGLGPLGRELVKQGIDVFVLPGQEKGRADYLSSLKFRRAVQERQVDIVHSHSMTALFDASLCRATVPGAKTVHTFHFGNYPHGSWRYHLGEALCARVPDRLIAVGFEQKRRIQATYRLPESRLGVIWNGVSATSETADVSFRAEVGTGDRLLVGTIAKLIEQKGLDDLLLVARQCRDAGLKMQFVIVGEGPLRSVLEHRRRELGLDDTVVITGWVPNAATRALPAFDVFFQPSRWEAMSIAILEAMALGKAIVATDVGDNARVIEHGASGLIVSSGSIESMVDALSRVKNPDLRGDLGRAALARFERNFTLDHMIHGYQRVYRQVVSR